MAGPFAEGTIVTEFETGEPDRYYRIEPHGLAGDVWLHRPGDVEAARSPKDVVERYALPGSDEYRVTVVDVPPGETLQLGTAASRGGREGGGDLVRLASREAIPASWIAERTTLAALLD